MKQYLIALLVIAATLIGCDDIVYKIELKPKGDKIIRTLTASRSSAGSNASKRQLKPLEDADLTAIAKAYSAAKPGPEVKEPKFTGTFQGVMPNDVGGSGRYSRFESKLGVSSAYIERFRGNDRPGEVIEASLKAVDEFTDILIGYIESQMGSEPGFAALRKFLDTELRKDLKNISVYSYMLSSPSRLSWMDSEKADQENQQAEVLARVAAYLIERDYVKPDQLPLLRRHMTSGSDPKAGLMLVLKSLGAKAKLPNEKLIVRLAALLTDEQKFENTFRDYLKTTPQYKKAVKELKPADGDGKNREPSPDKLVLQPLFEKAVHFNIQFGSRTLDLQLAVSAKPDATNGKWNAKDGLVTWKGALSERDKPTTALPEVCYAVWSEPNEKFQTATFGKVVLSGKDLMDYCVWRKGLNADEAKVWDSVLAKHKPGKDLEAELKAALGADKALGYLEDGLKLLADDANAKKP
jgi:hypothetical protein